MITTYSLKDSYIRTAPWHLVALKILSGFIYR